MDDSFSEHIVFPIRSSRCPKVAASIPSNFLESEKQLGPKAKTSRNRLQNTFSCFMSNWRRNERGTNTKKQSSGVGALTIVVEWSEKTKFPVPADAYKQQCRKWNMTSKLKERTFSCKWLKNSPGVFFSNYLLSFAWPYIVL